jgi:hypothetical protein
VSTSQADAEAIAALDLPEGWSVWRGQATRDFWPAPPHWMHAPLLSAPTLPKLQLLIEAFIADAASQLGDADSDYEPEPS